MKALKHLQEEAMDLGLNIGEIRNENYAFSYDTWKFNASDLMIKEWCDVLYSNGVQFRCMKGLFLFQNEDDLNLLKLIM